MDSLTHIALGACVGAVLAAKPLGRKALLWGAAAQAIPDFDFLAGLWCDPAEDLLAHRGFTHSFLCVALLAPVLALGAARWHFRSDFSYRNWIFFFGLQMLIHLLLDALNVYGTGWGEPFSHARVSGNLLFVADPLFTFPLLVAAVFLFLRVQKQRPGLLGPAIIAFFLCSIYLVAAFISKRSVETTLLSTCKEKKITPHQYFTTPAPFTSFLWYCVVAADGGFYIGYRSVFDRSRDMKLTFFPQQIVLLAPVHDREDVQHLLRFSKGYYTLHSYNDSLVFNDLRFGQQMGWQRPKAPFSFYYYLEHPGQNNFLIQRGRIAGWSRSTFIDYTKRVAGF